jgi:heme/copper-type cytochrome/quinol oxidase subunit 3
LALGAAFLVNQALEYAGLLRRDLTISSDLFGATFFTVTGFHGLHVFGGLVVLAIMLWLVRSGDLTAKRASVLHATGLYWHFVDVVWIAVFSIIYLGVLQ